jgi:pyruvate/2-oxoglutarate dehydrogenase complex dihydrolipoamide dehydrogenase (E3) component
MTKDYDFIAIGGGSAGFNAARLASRHVARVALIDGAEQLGGLCILRGCMPSKTLIYAAEIQHLARKAHLFGLRIEAGAPDMTAVRAKKRAVIGEFASYREEQLKKGPFELLRAHARFVGPNELELSDGTRLHAPRILIGTGSAIAWPDTVPGLRESKPWTSDQVLDLDFIPESVIVLGGGVVACELAQYLARIGSRVSQIQRSAHVLRGQSCEAARVVEQAFRDEGIRLFTDTRLKSVAFDGTHYEATFEHGGHTHVERARHLLNALGRTPATGSLGLDTAGIALKPSGHIATDAFQQTNVPGVYAAGDCAGPHEIVHVAIQQAECATRHALGLPVQPMDYSTLLQVVFTDPQLATVGRSQAQLREAGVEPLVASYPFDDHGKSILMEAKYGHVKVLAEPGTGRLLGAEIVGRDAGEMIHVFAVALATGSTAADMLKTPWYHPTLTEIVSYPLEDIVDQING